MKKYLKRTGSLLLFCMMLSQFSFGQSIKRQSIGSYGSNGFKSGAVFGQTIGQPFSTVIYTDSELSLTPGFQQPYTYKSGYADAGMKSIGLDVYPNPASAYFTLESLAPLESAVIQVSDMNGRLLINEEVSELSTFRVNTTDWIQGMYFISLKVLNGQSNFSSKIIITE